MGRSKSRRVQVARYNPLAASDRTPRTHTKRAAIMPMLAKLSAPSEAERFESAAAIGAMIAEDTEVRKLLIRNQVIERLAERLSDASISVKFEVSNTLRNLVLDEEHGDSFCESLYKANALPLLEASIRDLKTSMESDSGAKQDSVTRKYTFGYAENIAAILLSFCETSDTMLTAVNKKIPSLIPFLLTIIKICDTNGPASARLCSSQCLLSYTDDNEEAVSRLCSESDQLNFLVQLAAAADLFIASAAAGVLLNVISARQAGRDQSIGSDQLWSVIVGSCGRTLTSVNLSSLAGQEEQQQNDSIAMIEMTLENLSKLATIRSTEPKDGDAMDIDENPEIPESLWKVLSEVQNTMLTPLVAFATPIKIPEDQVYPAKLQTIHLLALDCLHNIAWVMLDSPKVSQVWSTWVQNAPNLWTCCLTSLPQLLLMNEEISDSAMSLLYGIAKTLQGQLVVDNAIVSSFVNLYHSSLNAELQSKIVGVLGCLATVQGHVDLNKAIGTFLITVIASLPRSDADAVIEALDAVFDIYADAAFDYDRAVFVQGNFLKHLEGAQPKLSALLKSINKKTQRGLWQRTREAMDNLAAFIEYKRSE